MGAPAPWDSDPVVGGNDVSPAPAADAPWTADEPVDPADTPADAPQGSGFTDEQKQQIDAYIPKAKDAADLEQFSHEVSGGSNKIGNAQQVLDAYKAGHRQFSWAAPGPPQPQDAEAPPKRPALDQLRNAIGDGLLAGVDKVAPGLGTWLANHREAGKAFTEHVANAVAADYGPELGGLLDTLADPGGYGAFGDNLNRNVAHERATMEGDSQGHGIASTAGELTGIALDAPLAAEAVGATGATAAAPRLSRALQAMVEGGAYGSGAAGPGNRLEGGTIGAALGTGTDAALSLGAKIVASHPQVVDAAAAAAAKAAQDLGIDLPRFVIGGTRDAKRASALEQTAVGSKPISDATNKMLDQSEAARTSIASGVGKVAEPSAMGDQAAAGGIKQVKSERARIGKIYDQARKASDDIQVAPTATMQTLAQLVRNERQVPGGTRALPIIEHYADAFSKGGPISIDGARGMRTELRSRLRDEGGMTPDNADRVTGLIMDSVNADITNGLKVAGKDSAIPLYRKADAQWAAQRTAEDDVLKPFLGKDFDNWGEDVAKKINADAKGNGTRLAQFLHALPDEDANTVRASLISRLGTAKSGVQNAEGDAFSLDQFLTNWNEVKGARNLIFPKETVQSLDRLAKVAEVVKVAGRTKNRSNTGGVVSYLMKDLPTQVGAGTALLTHDPKLLVYGMMLSGARAARQFGAAKLLASPAFARKLASTPLNEAGARAFWSRPWVKAMAVKNPAIAAEVQAFQRAFLNPANDNSGIVSSAVASPGADDQSQN